MAIVYEIINLVNNKKYVGITKTKINIRWNSHKCASKTRRGYLYNAIRKYGIENFSISALVMCDWYYACCLEQQLIKSGKYAYNLAAGGEGGFNVQDKSSWKKKLSEARKGGKPFAGKKHTEEIKKKCAEASRAYWAAQRALSND